MENKYYYKDGSVLDHNDSNKVLHREDGPAIICASGVECWYINNELHRDDDMPAYTDTDGNMAWYQNGVRHREYGPAVENADGTWEWWYHGEKYSEEEFELVTAPVANFTGEIIVKLQRIESKLDNYLNKHAIGEEN